MTTLEITTNFNLFNFFQKYFSCRYSKIKRLSASVINYPCDVNTIHYAAGKADSTNIRSEYNLILINLHFNRLH